MIELGCLWGRGSTCADPNQDLFPAMLWSRNNPELHAGHAEATLVNNVFQRGTPFLLRSTCSRKRKLSLRINQRMPRKHVLCNWSFKKKGVRGEGAKAF